MNLILAYNSHVGDARVTESNQADKLNIGQLIRDFNAKISSQFDIVIHIEITPALRLLEIHPTWADPERELL